MYTHYISKGTKPGTIVCIHGNSSSAKIYKDLLQNDKILYTKLVVNLPGHGDNFIKNSSENDFSIAAYKLFLNKILYQIDEEILLVGNSLGGHLAIEIAPKIQKLVGLVIMGTPPVKKPINFEEAFVPLPALNTFFTEHSSHSEINKTFEATFQSNDISLVVEDFKKTNPLVRKALATEIQNNSFSDEYKIFTGLDIRKYIISGDSDISINREYLNLVKNNCKNSCNIIDIENCGHYPSYDKPKEFNRILKNIANNVFSI